MTSVDQEQAFVPGLELSRGYFADVVEPIVAKIEPGLRYSAGLIGTGSDVVGFDTARSMYHDWGPRLVIWLAEDDFAAIGATLPCEIGTRLPPSYRGFATRFLTNDDGTVKTASEDAMRHLVAASSVRRWFGGGDRADPATASWIRLPDEVIDAALAGEAIEIDPATWVTLPAQWLLESTVGGVFRDDLGAISALRETLAWYPDDVWRYLMAAQWRRLDQMEPFVGRCAEVGDDLGSQLVAFSQIRDVMRLAFLQERQYAPYAKWFGSGFARLEAAAVLGPLLDAARYTTDGREREANLVRAVQWLGDRQNAMGVAEPVETSVRMFYSRPFEVLSAVRFGEALMAAITDPRVRQLPWNLGGIDQITDSTDVVGNGSLQQVIGAWLNAGNGKHHRTD